LINEINKEISRKLYKEFELPVRINSVEQHLTLPCFFIFNLRSLANSYGGILFSTTYTIDVMYKGEIKVDKEKSYDIFDKLRSLLTSITVNNRVFFTVEEGTYLEEGTRDRHFVFKITIPNQEKNTLPKQNGFYDNIKSKITEISGLDVYFQNGEMNEENLKFGFFILRPLDYRIEKNALITTNQEIRRFELILFEKLENTDSYSWLEELSKKIMDWNFRTDSTVVFTNNCEIYPNYKYTNDDELGIISTYKLIVTTTEK